ncbi:MAG: stage III sporulation protein AB [Lachnospiraceae bacterium]
MSQIIGMILIVFGCVQVGRLMVLDMQVEISEIVQFERMFLLLKSEIEYKKESLSCASRQVGEKLSFGVLNKCNCMQEKKGKTLLNISKRMEQRNGESFGEIWYDEWEKYLGNIKWKDEGRKRLLSFGEHTGYSDEQMQLEEIRMYIDEFQKYHEDKKKVYDEKRKLILSLTTATGVMLSIIFI